MSMVLIWLRETLVGRTLARALSLGSGAGIALMLNILASAIYGNNWSGNDNLLTAAVVVLLALNLAGTEILEHFFGSTIEGQLISVAAGQASYMRKMAQQGNRQEVEDGLKTIAKIRRLIQKEKSGQK